MTQEHGLEGSEGPNRFSGKRDCADGEDIVPFKKRVRFMLSDDLKEITNNKTESSGANSNDVKVSSISGEENKMEIIPTTCTTCNDDFSASLTSQLEILRAVAELELVSRGDRSGEDEGREEVQNAAKEDGKVSNDGGKEETTPEGEDDCSGDAPDVVGDEEHIPNDEGGKHEDGGGACSPIGPLVECEVDRTDEVAVKDGDDGSRAPSGEEPSKVDNKLVEDNESKMIQDGDVCGKDETATEGEDGGGNDCFSPTNNTMIESNNDGNGEIDREEQGKHAAMEDGGLGNNSNSAPGSEEPMEGGEKPLDYDVSTTIQDSSHDCSNNALGDGKQAQEPELVSKHGGGSRSSYADTTAGSSEGDCHEQGQLATMEDSGKENIRNNEHGVEEQNKSKEPVESDHQEQGQPQTAINEDGGDGNAADVVVSREEVQDKKGKKPAEYVASRKDPESGPDCNQNAPDVIGNKQPPDHQETNLDADDEGSGPHTFLVSIEGDHNDQIQQAAFEDPDGEIGNKNADANSSEYMAIQCDMQTQQDPMTTIDIRKRTRSINEQGEVSVSHDVGGGDPPGQEARKKCKFGSDGGSTSVLCLGDVGYTEPPMQQANHSFMLFGVTIPCEQEPDHVAINTNDGLESCSNHTAGGEFANDSPAVQQPTDGIHLFGAYMAEERVQPVAMRGIQLFGVHITGEHVQSVDMQNRDRGNSHGGGESSMRRPKSGLRLFGFEI